MKYQADSCTNYSQSHKTMILFQSLHTYLKLPTYNSVKVMAQEEYNLVTI
jgi:hypothetical protein